MNRSTKLFAWLPLLVLIAVLAAIQFGHPNFAVEPPALVLRLTLIFVVPVCFGISALAGRSYVARGDAGLLWLTCGAIFWASAGLVGTFLVPVDRNAGVTAHNILAWISAACHLAGIFVLPRPQHQLPGARARRAAAVTATVVIIAAVSAAAYANLMPAFFIQGSGGTPMRQGVLVSAILMFAFSAALLIRDRRGMATSFSYWYSHGLLLIAIGLVAVMLQSSPRSPTAWVGRIAQVIGVAYMLIAIFAAARSARELGLPLAIALHDAEKRFDDLIEMAADGIVVHEFGAERTPGRFVRTNPAVCALLGYSTEEMSRLTPADIIAADDPGQLSTDAAIMAREGRLMHETTLIGRDGRRVSVEINARMVPFEGRDVVVSIIHDISERRRLEEVRAHLAAIVQYSHDAIVAETLDGIITDWNRGATELFGYEADEVVGKSVGMLFPPGCLEAELTMRDDLKQGLSLRDYDTVRIRKDGSNIPVSITISPICDRSGVVVGISKIARDNTAKKQAEEMLGKAKAAAEEASRAKTIFLTNMSHEIRTPLHNIIGLAELLRRDATDPAQQQRLETLCATADHMLSIINDILELSRIEAVRLTLDQRDFLFGSVLDSVVAVIREPARAKGLDVLLQAPPVVREAVLRGDRLRLEQVLINLAGNAVKFTEHGAITISVECLASDTHGLRLRFAVSDTGIGIAPADRGRIFEAFEQVDASSRRTRSGSGLGLAICDRLVRAMGGAFDVTSEPGVGSTFAFELTLARGSGAPERPEEGAAAGADFSGSHVLVVEDNGLSRELLCEMVADLGCTVDLAADGVEAVEKSREIVYDLILMDVQMPRLDGFGATRAIRALPEHQHTPIVAITANAFAEDRQLCLDAGMNGHLRKPVTRAALAAELGNWLAGPVEPAGAAQEHKMQRARLQLVGGLDKDAMLAGHPAGVRVRDAMVREYLRLHRSDVAQLREHLAQGHYAAARQLLHTLEGAAAMIGARGVEQAFAELSAALRSGEEGARYEALARTCENEFERLAESLSAA
jgi:PAS domain S-box-containing protein